MIQMLKLCRTCKYDWDGHCTIGYDNWKQNKAKEDDECEDYERRDEDAPQEIGRIAAISVKCKTCGEVFAMNRREILWYSNMGYPLPKRCPECRRKKRKEGKEHV